MPRRKPQIFTVTVRGVLGLLGHEKEHVNSLRPPFSWLVAFSRRRGINPSLYAAYMDETKSLFDASARNRQAEPLVSAHVAAKAAAASGVHGDAMV